MWSQLTRKASTIAVASGIAPKAAAAAQVVIRATIATSTAPCLMPPSGRNRKSRNRDKTKKQLPTCPKGRRLQRIEELKRELSPNEDTSSLELAPTVVSGPPPSLPWKECNAMEKNLRLDLRRSLDERLTNDGKKRMLRDLQKIYAGKLTRREEVNYVINWLDKSRVEGLQGLRRVLTSHWQSDNFDELLGLEMAKVSATTREKISQILSTRPMEDFSPLAQRVLNRHLLELPPYMRKEHLKKLAEIRFKSKIPLVARATGPSMLPTLLTKGKTVQLPLTVSSKEEVAIGQIVVCVVQKPDHHTNYVNKRVRALEGDVVDFKGGRVIVPEGHCWIVGDNEEQSYDSRHYGAVPLGNIRARVYANYNFYRARFKWVA